MEKVNDIKQNPLYIAYELENQNLGYFSQKYISALLLDNLEMQPQDTLINGRFKIQKQIGSGTFGKLFLVQDVQTGTFSALKTVITLTPGALVSHPPLDSSRGNHVKLALRNP